MEEIKKADYVFIVLHYNERSLLDTFECVESLKKISTNKNFKIIIIENGSNDRSAKKIKEKYTKDLNVDYIISEKNLGFANGNNLGCSYAREKYSPKYLIVLNNDTYILQNDFLDVLKEAYEKTKFDILGPYIYDRNLNPQNPQLYLKTTLEEVELSLKSVQKILKQNIYILKFKDIIKTIILSQKYLELILRKILNKPKLSSLDKKEINIEMENVGLHGSCLIFSERYIEKYKDIFYHKTFMYIEEDILYNRVLKDNLKSIYYPKLRIYHKEDKSTEAIVGKSIEKQLFILKNVDKSLKVYKEILLNGE